MGGLDVVRVKIHLVTRWLGLVLGHCKSNCTLMEAEAYEGTSRGSKEERMRILLQGVVLYTGKCFKVLPVKGRRTEEE